MENVQPASDKLSLRGDFRKARRQFAEVQGRDVRGHLEANVTRLMRDLSAPGLQIATYRPAKEEVQFELQPVADFFYPALNGENLRFLKPKKGFVKGALGVEEPNPAGAEELSSSKPLLVFCPAVAVDKDGTRLGMGKGFYDRFFSDHPRAIRAAVVYQVQVSKNPLPADKWDQSLDWIVTETMILRTSTRRSS